MRSIQKRLILFFLSATAFTAALAAEGKEYFSIDGFQPALSLTFGVNDGKGFEHYRFLYQPQFELSSTYMSASAGLRAADRSLDAMTAGIWWPLRTARLRAGAGARYHFYYNDGKSTTHDILAGAYFEARPAAWFGLHIDTSYMFKARSLLEVEDSTTLLNHSIAFALKMDFHLPADISLHAGISSYEAFRYNVLCAPSFSAGISYEPQNMNLFFACEAVARYTDFFTNSAYYDSSEFRLTVGVRL